MRPRQRLSVNAALDRDLVRAWLIAAEGGDLPALRRMLGREPRLVDASGRGPYWTGSARAIHYAAHRGHLRVLRWLLDRGSDPNLVAGELDWAPLHFAALAGRRAVYNLLVRRGALPDVFTAAVGGDVKSVRRMIRENPRLVSRRGPDGATPLHFSGSAAVALALLAAGANPRVRDRYHHGTPIEWTLDRPGVAAVIARAAGPPDIFVSAALGQLPDVKRHVARNPRAVNARLGRDATLGGPGVTPLALAARFGRGRVVQFLVEAGARVDGSPSPLPAAVHGRSLAVVRRLLDAGADPNAFGSDGHAALHAAAVYGTLPMIRLLVSRGARLDLEDRVYRGTPLGWARHHGHARAVAFLRAAEPG